MQIRRHQNGVAIALAGLAVVIATTGTAVAVTTTSVNIADPSTASRIAHVDSSGRLQTTGPTNTIDSTGLAFEGDTFLTSPTTARLAITKISFSNPSVNSTASFAEIRFYVYKVTASGNTCTTTSERLLGIYNIAPGDDFEDVFATPLLITPTGSAKYCLYMFGQTLNGAYSANYLPSYNIAGYVVGGTYTGIGLNGVSASPAQVAKREKAKTGR